MEKAHSTKGKHVIVDMHGIDSLLLDNISYLKTLGRFAIALSGAKFVGLVEKKFMPVGCTVLFLLAESHLSFHSYVHEQFLSCDMYCCGDADPNVAIDYIIEQLQPDPNRIYRQEIIRGVE